ncbi:MAG TPA: shikimate kinase [Mycobacteriales bacterium]|jgi:shikimate kinase
MNRVVLAGSMGAGKTTVGRLLAARLGTAYLDNDVALGRAPADVEAEAGLAGLHAAEAAALRAALERDGVVAAPGSMALDPALRALLRDETVVWLRARPDTLAARVPGSGRPLAAADVAALDAARRPGFAEVATVVVDVDGRPPEEIVDEIVARLGLAGP